MALSGTVWGTFSGRTTSQARPRISWSATQSVAGNYSDVTASLYYENYGPYYSFNLTNTTTLSINGDSSSSVRSWDLRNPPVTVLVWTRTVRVNHDPDGGKIFNLSASANTSTSFGTMSVNGDQTLDTIPRGASITSSANFTAGNNIAMSFSNPASGYLKVGVYVHDGTDYEPIIKTQNLGVVSSGTITFTKSEIDKIYTQLGGISRGCILRVWTYSDSGYSTQIGDYYDKTGVCYIPARATCSTSANLTIENNLSYTLSNPNGKYVRMEYWIYGSDGWYKVKDQNNGTGTSGTFTMSSTDSNNMYSRMANVTSASSKVRVYTYEHSDYTTQIQGYYDVNGTVSVNQTTNKPTFTTFTVGNLDKNIVVKDKYDNTLVTSSTSTLLGADTKMIKGYSKLRAVVTSANKMVAKNYATASKYRFVSGSKYKEENYSSDSTVNLDIDNANEEDVSVTAYDSRSLKTVVNDTTSITNNAEYIAVSLWGMTLTRDNGIDSETKLAFEGSYWNEYFGGGTSGVKNTITAHYRYKETTASWGSQTWNSLTLTDTDGALSFDDYVNGDKGVNGFDSEKSFDIEVRLYDKLTNTISEKTLNAGIPVMDITKDGVAFGSRYDAVKGGALQISDMSIVGYTWKGEWVTSTVYALNDTVENNGSGYVCTSAHTSGATTEPGVGASWTDKWDLFVEGMPEPNITTATTTNLTGYLYGDGSTVKSLGLIDGWIPITDFGNYTFTLGTADDPSFPIEWDDGMNLLSYISVGMKVKWTQNGTVRYGFITYADANGGLTNTEMVIYGGTDYNVDNTTTYPVSNICISREKSPYGFPMSPSKWSVRVTDTTNRVLAVASASTWYNVGSFTISIPIGVWDVFYMTLASTEPSSATTLTVSTTLSTGNNSETDKDLTSRGFATGSTVCQVPAYRRKTLTIASKTSYYINLSMTGGNRLDTVNAVSAQVCEATCAYL